MGGGEAAYKTAARSDKSESSGGGVIDYCRSLPELVRIHRVSDQLLVSCRVKRRRKLRSCQGNTMIDGGWLGGQKNPREGGGPTGGGRRPPWGNRKVKEEEEGRPSQGCPSGGKVAQATSAESREAGNSELSDCMMAEMTGFLFDSERTRRGEPGNGVELGERCTSQLFLPPNTPELTALRESNGAPRRRERQRERERRRGHMDDLPAREVMVGTALLHSPSPSPELAHRRGWARSLLQSGRH